MTDRFRHVPASGPGGTSRAALLVLTALLGLGACGDGAEPVQSDPETGIVITGTASFRERLAIRPGVVFEATLEDVSRTDAKAEVLGTARIEDAGNPPYVFEIAYDSTAVDERHRYVVRAALRLGDRLLFTTDTAYPVLTQGAGTSVELLLKRVAQR